MDGASYNRGYNKSKRFIVYNINEFQNLILDSTAGSHNLVVYPDITIIRAIIPAYIKSLLDSDETVLALPYYDHPSTFRQTLEKIDQKIGSNDIEKYINDGSLIIVDSFKAYNPELRPDLSVHNKINFLSLIRVLLNHSIKNSKKGISIISDMGSFFHYRPNHQYNKGNGNIHRLIEYEMSIPHKYKELQLKKFCLYHQKDYELHFTFTHQKAQLVNCHDRSILFIDSKKGV